jgi:hypothetical protein
VTGPRRPTPAGALSIRDHVLPKPVRDILCGLAVALIACGLYVATLQPDFGGPEDTPKFQFIGRVLGTAHPPGYPLYVLLTHVFVKLPIGTIAYRANLFSALMAVLACLLTYVNGRQIGAGRWASACAACGLAAGASFWRSAVFAEVYSLAAFMAALTVTLLLAWGASGRRALLLGAVAAFAAGLGNHLTLAGIAPACLLYVLARNRRALTPGVVAAACVLLLLGVSQYGFIILRTHQQAPYLESRAESMSELAEIVTAQRYAGQRFAFTPRALLTEQAPVITRTLVQDLGVAGLAFFTLGALAAVRRRSKDAALLMGAAAGLFGMVLNLSGDIKGFVTPIMVTIWPLCALGAEAVAQRVAGLHSQRTLAAVIAAAAVVAMPLTNVFANYRAADQSGSTLQGQFFRALHNELPDGAVVVAEDYFFDMAIKYLQLSGEGPPGKRLGSVPFDAADVRAAAWGQLPAGTTHDPRPVFAFAGGATFLSAEGFQFVPVPVPALPLEEWLRELPAGTIVTGATAELPGPLDLAPIGHAQARPFGRPQRFEAFAANAHRTGARWNKGDLTASVAVDSSMAGGGDPPFGGTARAIADAQGARIEIQGRTIARTDTGVALAAVTREGTVVQTLVFPPAGTRRVPFPQAVYQLRRETPCVQLKRGEWQDATAVLAAGSWVATLLQLGASVVETESLDASPITLEASGILGDASARSAGERRQPDGRVTWLSELQRTGTRRAVFRLAADRPGIKVRARLQSGADETLKVCGLLPHPLFGGDRDDVSIRADFESEAYFGAGWSAPEPTPTGPVRKGKARSTLLLPLDQGYSYRVSLDLVLAGEGEVEILANGTSAGLCTARTGRWCDLTLHAAAGVSWITLVVRAPSSPSAQAPLTFHGAHIQRRHIDP